VSIRPHPSVERPTSWLVGPCFQVYQISSNVGILQMIMDHFGCGRISSKGPTAVS
jgi:hypothetical protein